MEFLIRNLELIRITESRRIVPSMHRAAGAFFPFQILALWGNIVFGNLSKLLFHRIDVIEQEVFYADIKDASFIVPANNVVTNNHNLHKRIVDLQERTGLLLALALLRYRQCRLYFYCYDVTLFVCKGSELYLNAEDFAYFFCCYITFFVYKIVVSCRKNRCLTSFRV